MKHRTKIKKLGRKRDQRKALNRSLVRSLVLEEKIITTEAKARALRPIVEKIITRSKEDSIANRRLISSRLGNDYSVTKKIFSELGPRYKDRKGGYTRIKKIFNIRPNGRETALIEFV